MDCLTQNNSTNGKRGSTNHVQGKAFLTKLKKDGKITEDQYKYLYPTSEATPRLYCTPKIHKANNPLDLLWITQDQLVTIHLEP